MEENEIMIGDWLRLRYTCRDTGREVVKDFQITEIRKNGETLYAWGKGGNMGRVEKLEPIPITPEILEKNGFECRGAWCLPGEDMGLRQDGDTWAVLSYYVNYTSIPFCYISCIHQLQHALRLCRIDLDIVL